MKWKCQLKKMVITSSSKKYHIFLGFDVGRNGFITRENLQDVLVKHHLPCENDIVDSVRQVVQHRFRNKNYNFFCLSSSSSKLYVYMLIVHYTTTIQILQTYKSV